MPLQGKIVNWNDDRGYGFIAPKEGGREVFVHIRSFSERHRRPHDNDVVTYDLGEDQQGRPCATDVDFVHQSSALSSLSQDRSIYLITIGAFAAFLIGMVLLNRAPALIAGLYVVTSVAAFVLYAIDKSAAKHGRWRTPESTLHLISLAGGWPGALIAQKVLRHKSRKTSFQIVFWITVVINSVALAWFLLHGQSWTSAIAIGALEGLEDAISVSLI